MIHRTALFIFIILTCHSGLIAQKTGLSFEINGGIPYNIPAPLSICQDGQDHLNIIAHYRSEPFTLPVYWDVKLIRSGKNSQWELELMHHKLFLDNPPEEVQFFSVTHGYNILAVSRSFRRFFWGDNPTLIGLGAGFVLSHPENEIRGKKMDQHNGIFSLGYYISGPVLILTAAQKIYITNRSYILASAKFYPSFSTIPIADGVAKMWSIPITFSFGAGIDIKPGS